LQNLKVFFYLILLSIGGQSAAYGQYWKSVGDSIDLVMANYLFNDTAEDRLYITGNFPIYDTAGFTGYHSSIKYLNNGSWDTIAKKDPNPPGNIWLFRYKNKLYASGNFKSLANSGRRFWAVYNGTTWDSLVGPQPDGPASEFVVIDDTLYIGGAFERVGDVPSPALVKFDGQKFHPMDDTIVSLDTDISVSAIKSYKGRIYVGGNLINARQYPQQEDLIYYENGKQSVPKGWYMDDSYSWVSTLEIFQDELYVGGYFQKAQALSNNILKTDGEHWYSLGRGCNGAINNMMVYKNELWVIGSFTECGGVPARFVAKWDGKKWCSPGNDQFNRQFHSIVAYKDTIYISGKFTNLGPDSANWVAKWAGGSHVWQCGSEITSFEPLKTPWASAEEVELRKNDMSVFPSPAGDFIQVIQPDAFSNDLPYQIVNLEGKSVMNGVLQSNVTRIDVSKLPTGRYVLRSENKTVSFIKQ